MIYTDSQTHSYAQEIFQGFPWHRYELINLDLDPRDALRMAPFRREDFDDKNWASVRRTLADCDHLDVRKLGQRLFLHFWLRKGRLLLGTDVKFLQRPVDFIEAAQSLREQQATYCVRKATTGSGSLHGGSLLAGRDARWTTCEQCDPRGKGVMPRKYILFLSCSKGTTTVVSSCKARFPSARSTPFSW